jgi:hypothetical protein
MDVALNYPHSDQAVHQNFLALTDEGAIKGISVASETHDFASLADGAGETGSITVIGAALGDFVLVSAAVDIVDMTFTGYVQSADTVEYRMQNESGSVADLASTTVSVLVFHKG